MAVKIDDRICGDVTLIASSKLGKRPPKIFRLSQNYPNPFNQETTIRYYLARPGRVRLAIYDVLGRMIRKLADEQQDQGTKIQIWDGLNMNMQPANSGLYFYRLEVGSQSEAKGMLLLR